MAESLYQAELECQILHYSDVGARGRVTPTEPKANDSIQCVPSTLRTSADFVYFLTNLGSESILKNYVDYRDKAATLGPYSM